MGLLDTITDAVSNIDLGDALKNITSNETVQGFLKDHPQILEKVQGMDTSKVQEFVNHIKTNGIPKDLSELTKIFGTGATPAASKPAAKATTPAKKTPAAPAKK